MPRSGVFDFLVNVLAGVLALALLVGIAYFLYNSGVLDPYLGLLK